jgi:hypothetical protein
MVCAPNASNLVQCLYIAYQKGTAYQIFKLKVQVQRNQAPNR